MKYIATGLIGLASLMGASTAFADNLIFTSSDVVTLPGGRTTGAAAQNLCAFDGVCTSRLSFNTVSGGKLTVTAGNGSSPAYVFHGNELNTGLGVASGTVKNGVFSIDDRNFALDDSKETLTLNFSSAVAISALYFFPDDRAKFALTHELDNLDGFTISIDGGAAQEFSFGLKGGQPVSFNAPLVGSSFTLGYARHKSPEDYFLAGLSFTAAVPEASTYGMLALGLAGISLVSRRRRQA